MQVSHRAAPKPFPFSDPRTYHVRGYFFPGILLHPGCLEFQTLSIGFAVIAKTANKLCLNGLEFLVRFLLLIFQEAVAREEGVEFQILCPVKRLRSSFMQRLNN